MIETLVVGVLMLLAAAYVATPLRGTGPRWIDTDPVEEADARKRAALGALVDLDAELEVDKLSAADHESLKRQYEAAALAALDELERLEALGDPLEAEIAARRDALTCPTCGALRTRGEPCPDCER